MTTAAHDSLVEALAVRAGLVDLDRLDALRRAGGNGHGLAERMLERGWIDERQRAALEAEVLRLLREHDGDLDRTLADVSRMEADGEAATLGDDAATLAIDATRVDPPSRAAPRGDDASSMPTLEHATDASTQETIDVDAEAETRLAAGAPDAPLPSTGISSEGSLSHVLISTLGEPPEGDTTRYTLSHVHARGGIGQVWLARDGSMGRDVAMKEIRADRSAGAQVWTRFVEEARITGQLEHPGIVPVYEVGRRKGDRNPYYTMRFVRGKTLAEAIRAVRSARAGGGDPLAERRLLEAFVSICQTLAYAHARGVIHRDLKTANVVLGDYGEVIVLDWGLAKLIDDPNSTSSQAADAETAARAAATADTPADDATRLDKVEGTPAYMAPEQAAGWVHKIDARTDVYGLGAILYEILTGRPPYERAELKEMLRRVRQDPPAAPRSVDPTAPPALEAVCLKALSKPPEARYQTAEALGDEVRRWLADEPVLAFPEPWTKRLSRWAKKHRTAVAAAAALVGTSIVALSVGYVLVRAERDEAARSRDFARGAVDTMYTDVAEDWLEDHVDATQRRFLEEARAYYADFARRDAGTPEMILATARAHHRVGEVERKLGRNAEAEAAYAEAIRRLTPLAKDDSEARRQLARTEARLGALRVAQGQLEEGDRLLAGAIAALEPFAAPPGAGAEAKLDLARARDLRGEALRLARKNAEAAAEHEAAIADLRPLLQARPDDVAARKELGRALTNLGYLRSELPDGAAAGRAALEEALAVQRPLLQQFPTIPRIRQDHGLTATRLGILQRDAGQVEEAEASYRAALDDFRRLATDFPARPEYRRELSRSFNNLATLLQADRARPLDALAVYAEAVPVLRALADEVPDEPKPLRDLAITTANMGSAHMQLGQLDEAARRFDEAGALYDRLVGRFPDVPDNVARHASLLAQRAGLEKALRRLDEAESLLARARGMLDGLVAAHPDTLAYRADRAGLLAVLGEVLARMGPARRADALAAYAAAEADCDELLRLEPGSAAHRSTLGSVLANLSDLETLPADDPAELPARERVARRALALYEELAGERPGDVGVTFALGAICVNLGEIVERRDPASEEPGRLYARAAELFGGIDAAQAGPGLQFALGKTRGRYQAGFALARGDVDAARRFLDQGLEGQKAALAAMRTPEHVEELARGLTLAGDVALKQGRHADAVRLAMDLSRLVPDDPAARRDAARLMAAAIPVVESDPGTAPSRREEIARSYADRAVAQLRVAVDSGLKGDALKVDAFTPLEARDDFRGILRDLAAGAATE
jgi:serine/threonine protein kinase